MDSPKLRILVLANLPPFVVGGAENQVARLVGAWRALGATVEVWGSRIPDGEVTLGGLAVATRRVNPWRRFGRLGRAAGYAFSLIRGLYSRSDDFDVIYCRGLGDAALALSLGRALGLFGIPVVAVPINAGRGGDADFIRSVPGWRVWCALIDRHVFAFNLINAASSRDLDALGLRRARRTSIPNGVPVLGPTQRSAAPIARRLVWTGRMEHQKGLDLLLHALSHMKSKGIAFRLTLVGEGTLRSTLVGLAQSLRIESEIDFAGVVDAAAVRQVLGESDAFVLPSRYEGMSNSALEAMEAGLPVLATHCGGIDVAISEADAGWLCNPDDLVGLSMCLESMLSESPESWLARGNRARELVVSRFSIDSVANANLQLLASVAYAHR